MNPSCRVRLATAPLRSGVAYEPSELRPAANHRMARGVEEGLRYQTLLGVTGSGRRSPCQDHRGRHETHAGLAPNKTLAASWPARLKVASRTAPWRCTSCRTTLLPARGLVPRLTTFIEGRFHQRGGGSCATRPWPCSRGGFIVVARCRASTASAHAWTVRHGGIRGSAKGMDHDDVQLHRHQYDPAATSPGTNAARSACAAITWACSSYADRLRIEFWGDEIERIAEVDNVTGEVVNESSEEALPIWPASHCVAAPEWTAHPAPSATSC